MERLFIKTYLLEYENLIAVIEIVDTVESLNQISNIEVVASFLEKHQKVKLQGLKGELQYIYKIETLYHLQFAIYTNNFSLKLMAWEKILPFCYATNKVH